MNTEERQLAEMLHRVTPEPPRRVTVEDVAFRLANEAGGPAVGTVAVGTVAVGPVAVGPVAVGTGNRGRGGARAGPGGAAGRRCSPRPAWSWWPGPALASRP